MEPFQRPDIANVVNGFVYKNMSDKNISNVMPVVHIRRDYRRGEEARVHAVHSRLTTGIRIFVSSISVLNFERTAVGIAAATAHCAFLYYNSVNILCKKKIERHRNRTT